MVPALPNMMTETVSWKHREHPEMVVLFSLFIIVIKYEDFNALDNQKAYHQKDSIEYFPNFVY